MALMFSRHPSRRRLREWFDLDASAPNSDFEAIGSHLDHCERCAQTLEDLSNENNEAVEFDERIGAVLREVYSPPEGIDDRVMKTLNDRQRSERDLNLFLGLFGLAGDTADLMLSRDDEPDDTGQVTVQEDAQEDVQQDVRNTHDEGVE